jgi:hypothetical protein
MAREPTKLQSHVRISKCLTWLHTRTATFTSLTLTSPLAPPFKNADIMVMFGALEPHFDNLDELVDG